MTHTVSGVNNVHVESRGKISLAELVRRLTKDPKNPGSTPVAVDLVGVPGSTPVGVDRGSRRS